MNYKEAIKDLKDYAENSWGGLNESFELAVETMEKAEKYRWHDLMENRYDLPHDYLDTLVCLKGFEGDTLGIFLALYNPVANIWATSNAIFKDNSIRAWKEIEPFEVIE